MKPDSWLKSINCAIEGILWSARTQRHMRYHLLSAVAVVVVALLFRVSALELILLTFVVILVLFAELVNTAIEVVVDLIAPEYHPLARRAKDVAAGAVLMTSIGAAITGYLVLGRYVFPFAGDGFKDFGQPPGELAVVSALTVIIVVVLLKSHLGERNPLHGGMPSGHAAVAFSIATSLVISTAGTIYSVLAVAMAAMVSHSRLLLKVHTLREVLVGAALGVMITLTLYLLFA